MTRLAVRLRRKAIPFAVLVTMGAAAPVAQAKVIHQPLYPICQVSPSAAHSINWARLRALPVQQVTRIVCAHARRPHNYITAVCADAYMWNGKLGTGWIWEDFGVITEDHIRGEIAYGSADAYWYNFSTGKGNVYGPLAIYPGAEWDDTHNVYSKSGYIQSWMESWIETTKQWYCATVPGEPTDFTSA